MDQQFLAQMLKDVAAGTVTPADAMESLRTLPYHDMGFASLDYHRAIRTGYPEVVFCQGKTDEQVAQIIEQLAKVNAVVIGTRATKLQLEKVNEVLKPQGKTASFFETARIIQVGESLFKEKRHGGNIAVVTAGTADIPVAEEAAVTAEIFGNAVSRVYDVGVAGIHRLFAKLTTIREANVVIVVAGMEGALASVVGGLIARPVIAVPTSIGYGANLQGVSALLSMLNSCANGVATVNIDNGFGAGYLASMINDIPANE